MLKNLPQIGILVTLFVAHVNVDTPKYHMVKMINLRTMLANAMSSLAQEKIKFISIWVVGVPNICLANIIIYASLCTPLFFYETHVMH
jgi:hypothetical protein